MVHHQRGVKWTPQLSRYDEESTGSNSTPIRTNSGRPPLPIRRISKNRLPPSSSRDGQHVVQVLSPLDSSKCTQYSASTMTSSGGSLASLLEHPREAVRDGGEQWRKHGKLFRARLLMRDEESGGNTFVLSSNCQIERYYDVAEKVLDQFLATSIDEKAELTESYLVGNRLVKFLSTVLPTHKDYFQRGLEESRNRSQAQLIQLLQYLEQLALIIDEDELNKYILQDLSEEDINSSLERRDLGVLGDDLTELSHLSASPIRQNVSSHSLEDFETSLHSFSMHSGQTMSTMTASHIISPRASPEKRCVNSYKVPNQFLEYHESHIRLLQSDLRRDEENPARPKRCVMQQPEDDTSSVWDAQFFESGIKHGKTLERAKPPFSTVLENGMFAEGVRSSFPHLQAEPTRQEWAPAVGSEWSPTFHSQDPFNINAKKLPATPNKGKRSVYADHLLSKKQTTSRIPTPERGRSITKDMNLAMDPRARARSKPNKPPRVKPPVSTLGSASTMSDSTPTKQLDPPMSMARKSSPKSVLELADWGSHDNEDEEEPPVLRVNKGSMKSGDLSNLGGATNEELDTSLRRQPFHHFKGCVRCFVE